MTPTPITGTAAGVPFTALAPTAPGDGPTPLVITWHLMDAPCTDAAFAAALPLASLPAWRVHLGMPWCGARLYEAGREEAGRDPMLLYAAPVVTQAADEFPAALKELRGRLPVDDGPIAVVGGSLGGAVALETLARDTVPIAAAALINPAVRARSVVAIVSGFGGQPYTWTDEAVAAADRLDFVARAAEIVERTDAPAVLVVSGEQDFDVFRTDAGELVGALRERHGDPTRVRLTSVPGLAHPLAEQPGIEPAPQLPTAAAVDAEITAWFLRHLITAS